MSHDCKQAGNTTLFPHDLERGPVVNQLMERDALGITVSQFQGDGRELVTPSIPERFEYLLGHVF